MKLSARNQLKGIVSNVIEGAVNNEVTIQLNEHEAISTVITKASCETLGIASSKEAYAIVKAPWVVLAATDCGLNFSARNQYVCTIHGIIEGAVNATVYVRSQYGSEFTAIVTKESLQEMDLSIGDDVLVLIKASSVIVATAK